MENALNRGPGAGPRLPPGHRIYAIGDVHGHLDKLVRIHGEIRADLHARPVARPLVVHLGDLIDRGPDSAACIDLLASRSSTLGVPTVNLMGNHEWMMLRALAARRYEDIDTWLDNGGDVALRSWGLKSTQRPLDWMAAIPAAHLGFLKALELYHVDGRYMFVHAGVRPGVPLDQQRQTDLLWIRESFLRWTGTMLPEAPGCIIVHGHTPSAAPDVLANRIGLDTGAGRGGPLTCAVLEGDEVRVVQVS